MGSIKRELEDQRSALTTAISSSVGSARDEDQGREVFKDPYAAASAAHEDGIAAAMVERRARQLKEVNRALEEMDAGRYGICRECDAPIPKARLRVMPFATRCVECQARSEGQRAA
jgi:DnaK suppressor protein